MSPPPGPSGSTSGTIDVAVIGGGVVGCAIARELARHRLDVHLFERAADVCAGTSKANSGVVHSAVYNATGSLKARHCLRGNQLYDRFAGELGVEAPRVGKLTVAVDDEDLGELEKLMDKGRRNGVPGLRILNRREALEREPNVDSVWALDIPTAGIVSPYTITIAAAENAARNGVRFHLNSEVTALEQDERAGETLLVAGPRAYRCRLVVNSAGLYSDVVAGMAGVTGHRLHPLKGQYYILDRSLGGLVTSMIYPVPPKRHNVVGVHITPTTEGNIILGPTADYNDDREDRSTDGDVLKRLLDEARELIPSIPRSANIRNYAGLRARSLPRDHPDYPDYAIGTLGGPENIMHLIGIESPGLTAAPALAEDVAKWAVGMTGAGTNPDFDPRGRPVVRFHRLPIEKRRELLARNPDYGTVVCRCEHITKAEVLQALDNPLGVRTLSGIKYRCRAQMGRCQAGFCTPRIIGIMEERFGTRPEDIVLRGPESWLFPGRTKDRSVWSEERPGDDLWERPGTGGPARTTAEPARARPEPPSRPSSDRRGGSSGNEQPCWVDDPDYRKVIREDEGS